MRTLARGGDQPAPLQVAIIAASFGLDVDDDHGTSSSPAPRDRRVVKDMRNLDQLADGL